MLREDVGPAGLPLRASGLAIDCRDGHKSGRSRPLEREGTRSMTEHQAGVITTPRPLAPELQEPWRQHRVRIAGRSQQLVSTYGDGPRALDYENWADQQARFHVMAEALPLNGRRILDVGCGFADFADYLTVNYGPVSYEGVDLCEAVIAKARGRHPAMLLRVLDILEEDPGGPYDFVVANGIFDQLSEDAIGIVRALITRMFELSGRAVAFTARSAWAEPSVPQAFRADPLAMLAFCRTLTPRVTLRHDYQPGDFAIFMRRGGYAG
jgi:SAM-dependent methyltransferase